MYLKKQCVVSTGRGCTSMIMNLFKRAVMNSILGNYSTAINYYLNFISKATKCYRDLKSGCELQSDDEKEAAINLINAWCNLGNLLKFLGDTREAIKCFYEALKLNPKDPLALREAGDLHRKSGEYERALRCFEKCLKLNPRDVYAWIGLGTLYEAMGRLEDSAECYRNVLNVDPRNGIAWYNLGVIYDKLEKSDRAVECYKEALEIDPENKHAWVNLGNYYMKRLDLRKALIYYNRVLEIDPYYEKAWYYATLAWDCLRDTRRQVEKTPSCEKTVLKGTSKTSKKR